jgi:glycosyltransferase involved in cell wall biosynthesis
MSQSIKNDSTINAWKFLPLVKCLYPLADKVVAVSHGVANDLHELVKLPTEKIAVIYNPVVTPGLLTKSQVPVDHPWFTIGQLPVILGVGRLSRAKNFSTLIRAFAQRGLHLRARLMILGEGELRPDLEALVSELGLGDTVCLPGFVNNPFAFMARSALCVLSSVQEGFPNVIVQAMAVGTPVVATDCLYGPAEILEGGKYGRLIPVDSVEAMAQAIDEELVHNRKQDSSLRLRLMERADCFSQERSIRAYSSIFFGDSLE